MSVIEVLRAKALRVVCVGAGGLSAGLVCVSSATAVVSGPVWAPMAISGPTNLPPEGKGTIAIYVQNVSGVASSGSEPLAVTDVLPAGLTTAGNAKGDMTADSAGGWSCLPTGVGESTVTCTLPVSLGAGLTSPAIRIPVLTGAQTVQPETNLVTAEGGGAASPASYEEPVTISATPAKPGVQVFTAATYNADGSVASQAGSHPALGTSAVFANTIISSVGDVVPAGDPKTIAVDLPTGYLGNPTATPRCPEGFKDKACSIDTQVGVVQPITNEFGNSSSPDALHNVQAPVGYPAKFTFSVVGDAFQINAIASIRTDEDYGATITSPNTAQISPVFGAFFTIWGNPASHSHDEQRCVVVGSHTECGASDVQEKAFVTLPEDCALQVTDPPFVKVTFDTWLIPGVFDHQQFPAPAVTGCDQLHLNPSFTFEPDQHAAASPAAFSSDLKVPQEGLVEPEGLATPEIRTVVATLPAGVTLNPSSADGLKTCSSAQIGLRGTGFAEPNRIRFTKSQPECPEASKVGTVELTTPLLEAPLKGDFYLASQEDNPFHNLLAGYIVIDDPLVGIVAKIPGRIEPDPVTGQLTAIFDDTPQLPFDDLKLNFKGGDRSPLATPDTCGTFTTKTRFTPWSAPESGPDTVSDASFEVTSGPGGGPCVNSKAVRPFHPAFDAGTTGTTAGAYTPLEFKVTRKDGEQELKGLTFTLPPGLTGSIANVAKCSDSQIATAESKTGRSEQASASCPASSALGWIDSSSGIGADPIHVGGKLYLAGPYQGAPLSGVVIVPAVAGPYDLGNVVLRAALHIDPMTGQITAVTVGIPNIMKGIPLSIRSARVLIDRPGFISAPTSCERMSIVAKLTGAGGDTASSADDTTSTSTVPFQVGGCDKLGFKPSFHVSVSGKTSRANGASLSVKLAYPKAPYGTQANIRSVKVALPKQLPSRLTTLQKACPDSTFEANPAACPAGSRVGTAKAITPILAVPLEGPAYFVSHGGAKFPELIVVLQGEGITIDLHGETFISPAGITSSTFRTVPDQPVTSFELTLPQGPNSALAANGNLCAITHIITLRKKTTVKAHGHKRTVRKIVHKSVPGTLGMPTVFTAQNGIVIHQTTPIAITGCAKHKTKKPVKKASRGNKSAR